ncbi:hypothetical protein LZ30DRAFT_440947 [Colletotrichum cereale]|nr:hypothetical protein LZ30DRAFT_440947 [Colletotrichum cereale]
MPISAPGVVGDAGLTSTPPRSRSRFISTIPGQARAGRMGEQSLISRNLANGRGKTPTGRFRSQPSSGVPVSQHPVPWELPHHARTSKKHRPTCLLPAVSSRQHEQPRPATARGAELSSQLRGKFRRPRLRIERMEAAKKADSLGGAGRVTRRA